MDGKWIYGFTNPDYTDQINKLLHADSRWQLEGMEPEDLFLTVGQLKTRRDVKRLRVKSLNILEFREDHTWKYEYFNDLGMDLGVLLKFVSCLMDERDLFISTLQLLNRTSAGAVRKLVEETCFWRIWIFEFTAADQPLLDRRRKGGKLMPFFVYNIWDEETAIIVYDYLKSGKLSIFFARYPIYPFEVVETFIENFRNDPEDFRREKLHIEVPMDDTTPGMLEEMRTKGLCQVEPRGKWYIFESGQKHIYVNYDPNTAICRIHSTKPDDDDAAEEQWHLWPLVTELTFIGLFAYYGGIFGAILMLILMAA